MVINQYTLPLWPWERLADAMCYDLHHDDFVSFLVFRRYCEGAAIAPAAVFVHLCGITLDNEHASPPSFDIRRTALPLAMFSYLVHIMRDFRKDQSAGLNYFSDDLLAKHKLSAPKLRLIAAGDELPDSFRSLMADYRRLAEQYCRRARAILDVVGESLRPAYRLSLELIYALYLQILERIDPQNGSFTPEELIPSAPQVQERIALTLQKRQS